MNLYKNAIALPFSTRRTLHPILKIKGFENCRRLSSGGIYDKFGHLICSSIRKGGMGGDHVLSESPLFVNPRIKVCEVVPGKSIYIGNFMSHYGHFITEGLSRLFDFEVIGEFDNILVHPFIFNKMRVSFSGYHKFIFNRLGVDINRIKVIDSPLQIESIYVPPQLFTINGEVDQRLRKLYRHLKGGVSNPVKGGRFFLSRRESPLYSRIGNLSELDEFFSRNKFSIIYPEDMDIEEQLSVYAGADVVATMSGSGAHNAVFFKEGARLIELGDIRNSDKPIPMQVLVNSIADCEFYFVKFRPSKDKKNNWDLIELEKNLCGVI